MFKYTKTAIEMVVGDIRKIMNIFSYCSLIFTSLYFVYALIAKTGNFYANIVLCALFVFYTIFQFVTNGKKHKIVRKVVKRGYSWARILIKAFTLGAMLYGIYTATTKVSAISTILATLMIIMWVLQLLLEILTEVVEDKKDLLIAGIQKDIENIKKPLTDTTNFFKKVIGQEVIQNSEPSQEVLRIEKRLGEKKAIKEKLKADIKEAKLKAKEARKKLKKGNSSTEEVVKKD